MATTLFWEATLSDDSTATEGTAPYNTSDPWKTLMIAIDDTASITGLRLFNEAGASIELPDVGPGGPVAYDFERAGSGATLNETIRAHYPNGSVLTINANDVDPTQVTVSLLTP